MERPEMWISEVLKETNPVECIINDVRKVHHDKWDRDIWRLWLKTNVGVYQCDLTRRLQNDLMDALGDNEQLWIGKKVRITKVEVIGKEFPETRLSR